MYQQKQKMNRKASKQSLEKQESYLKLHESIVEKYSGEGKAISYATKTYVYFDVKANGIKSITLRINSASYDVRVEGTNQYKSEDLGHTKIAEQISNFTDAKWSGNNHCARTTFNKNDFTDKEVVDKIEQVVDFIKSDAIL